LYSSESRSWLHSIVARSVRWRSGASRAPPVSQRQRALETPKQRLGRQQLRPRGSELEREGQSVEPAANRLHRRVRRERATDPACAFHEERHGLLRRERVERILAFPGETQRRAARDEDTEIVRRGEQRRKPSRGGEQVLEVVEHEQ
jgi:hypothetical protein